jgi:nitrogen-specific signal transduction histidine kinase/CheY-like chemotaxis protein
VSDHKASFFNEDGSFISIDGIVFDITMRKRMEAELSKIQKLESIGIFAGGIAHDFNNILATLIGNIALAKDKEMSKDEIFKLLTEAEKASKRAQSLTKQLLTFAKGGAPVKETASIGEVVKESSHFVLSGSKSDCEFSIARDLWPVEADVGQISQVVNNIVINANQSMPEGGMIKIKAENLIIDSENQWKLKLGRYIRISIKDAGIGIASKHFTKIFDPYFTTKQEGSGLGLSTSYSIIKNHGGHITVESKLGSGTTFHIYLPASENSAPVKEESRVMRGHGRILLMDDDAMLREIIGRMLIKFGYEPEFAEDGAEAIEMYNKAKEAEKPYDAVIMDLTVPGGMGGKEAFQKLLVMDPEAKIIVSSGYSDDPILANFQEYGLKGVIPKPFELGALSKVLHEALKAKKE